MKLPPYKAFIHKVSQTVGQHGVNRSEKDEHMIIRRYRGYPVAVDTADGLRRLDLISRVLPPFPKSTSPSEYKRKKQVLEIARGMTPGGAKAKGVAFIRYLRGDRIF